MARATPPPPAHQPRTLRVAWLVVAVVLAASVTGGAVYAYEQYVSHVTVTGINWQVFLNNSSSGYLFGGGTMGCQSLGCPTNAPVASVWTFHLYVYYAAYDDGLSIRNLTVPAPFGLAGSAPPIPVLLVQGSADIVVGVTLQLPSSPGSYSILGTIWIAK